VQVPGEAPGSFGRGGVLQQAVVVELFDQGRVGAWEVRGSETSKLYSLLDEWCEIALLLSKLSDF
jgi:hypothetical protein